VFILCRPGRIAMEGRCEVVLTSFETARDFIHDINQVAWRTVIVDECHRIKEPAARTTIALKSLGTDTYQLYKLCFSKICKCGMPGFSF
jgi:hypothetical protein